MSKIVKDIICVLHETLHKTKQKYGKKHITFCLMMLSIGKIRGRSWWINEYGKPGGMTLGAKNKSNQW